MMKKRIFALLLALSLTLGVIMLPSCASRGEPMMSIADKTLTVNTYELLLSRMKGTLEFYGYDVDDESFWRTVVSADGSTYDDYFRTTILEEAYHYLISDYLFDREGLVMSEERESEVDALLEAMVKTAGSKTALNAELKEFGVNYEMLREIYILEEKIEMLREHLYGKDGEKIDEAVKQEYLEENYVAFGQIFLACYYYLTETDKNGDSVYYTSDKRDAIAYDKNVGETRVDEFGKIETDKLGDPVYYTDDGKIAYDKVNGKIAYIYVTDKDGKPTEEIQTALLSEEEQGKIFDAAAKYAEECDGDIDRFIEYAELYDEGEGRGEYMYLLASGSYYGAQSDAASYLDKIAEKLMNMEVGECAVVRSDYGCHVVFKYECEEGAYGNEKHKEVFADFMDSLIGQLYAEKCSEYEDEVEIDSATHQSAPTMAEVGSNKIY